MYKKEMKKTPKTESTHKMTSECEQGNFIK